MVSVQGSVPRHTDTPIHPSTPTEYRRTCDTSGSAHIAHGRRFLLLLSLLLFPSSSPSPTGSGRGEYPASNGEGIGISPRVRGGVHGELDSAASASSLPDPLPLSRKRLGLRGGPLTPAPPPAAAAPDAVAGAGRR